MQAKNWITAALVFLVFSRAALADGWETSNGSGRITSMSAESGVVRIWYPATDASNPDSCANTGVLVLYDDSKNGDRQYAALLAAHAAGKSVSFWVSGCYSGWGTTWPRMASVFVGQ